MLYLLFVLTFLGGILFYGMTPRDDKLHMDTRQAEGMIVSFLNQHQAAKDYLYTWLGVARGTDLPNGRQGDTNNLKDDSNSRLNPDFIEMRPKGVWSDMCARNEGSPGQKDEKGCKDEDDNMIPGFISRIVCTKSDGSDITGCREAGAKHYVITYGGWEAGFNRPEWWPRESQRVRRYERWRRAIAKRTRGSISCGTLIKIDADWCIDNGETVYKNESSSLKCMNKVPPGVISELKSDYEEDKMDDLLFCISEFKQGVKPGHYAATADYFYDSLANTAIGEHKDLSRDSDVWWRNLASGNVDLTSTRTTANPIQDARWESGKNYLSLHGYLNTQIQLSSTYTLTILLSAYGSGPLSCGLLQTSSDKGVTDQKIIFEKRGQLDGTDAVTLHLAEGEPISEITTSICNMNSSGNSTGIVSWTFVVKPCKDDASKSCIWVYENATRRFENKRIKATEGKYLLLGEQSGNDVPHIYGIRYYSSELTHEQIQKNFKVDQKRFGIPDINNGALRTRCVNEGDVHKQERENS